MNGKVLIQSGTAFEMNCTFHLNMSSVLAGEKWKGQNQKGEKKFFLGYKIWYRDISYVGCAENPLKLQRDHSGPAYPLWLGQNRVSVGTEREIPQKKDFLWWVYWPWPTGNAKEMPDLSRGLRRTCSSVPSFTHLMWIQCHIPLQSQETADHAVQLGLGFTVLCSICEAFVRAMQVHQSSMEQARHHVLTCSGALYKPRYFNTVLSNMSSQSWFLLLLPEGKLTVTIFAITLSQLF